MFNENFTYSFTFEKEVDSFVLFLDESTWIESKLLYGDLAIGKVRQVGMKIKYIWENIGISCLPSDSYYNK